jgi:allophanate hydrolase
VIEVVSTMALNTVQDLGRHGNRHIGVSTAGAMDALALRVGNCMLGNDGDAAAIEVQTFPFEVRFLAATRFALTGADARATLDGLHVLPWWHGSAREGQVLKLGYPTHGARAYVAFEGGIAVPDVLGSRSTDRRSAFGGLDGRFLKRGDRLRLGVPTRRRERPAQFGVVPPLLALGAGRPGSEAAARPARRGQVWAVRVLRAGEYERFPASMQQSFWDAEWEVTHQADRTGYRLCGPALRPDAHIEMRSYGVVPGLIQVPPGGQPIIQLSDANTAGGYPKIAAVIEADLWRVGQARAGDSLRFVDCAYGQARQATEEIEAYLAEVRRLIDEACPLGT